MSPRFSLILTLAFGPALLGGVLGPEPPLAMDEGCGSVDATPIPMPSVTPIPGALAYPERDPMFIKGLQPDFWPRPEEIAGNLPGSVAMNLVWATWEPTLNTGSCGEGAQAFDGHCFQVDAGVEQAIQFYTGRGVEVTAVIYGVPGWARVGNTECSPIAPGFEIFCTPDDPRDYGRFAGMLAERYNGKNGKGRIVDFVIHNEVNANDWFDIGCGQGTPCNTDAWVSAYGENYAAAYDAIKVQQSTAKVLISYQHDFLSTQDAPAASNPLLSVQTFTELLAPRLGEREWMIAYHPYAPNLFSPEFSAFDLPYVTYGNLGILLGWLRQTFPSDPHAWEVQLTESGINSSEPQSSEGEQAAAVCDTFRAALGTPGISSYIYHRMWDNPQEGGLQLGLARGDGTLKPAWSVWALANRADLEPPQLSCGFEALPYTRLSRGYDGRGNHWVTSRLLPPGFEEESLTGWRLPRSQEASSALLFECAVGEDHSFMSLDVGCEGQINMGPVGWIWSEGGNGRVPLHRCRVGEGEDHFVSEDPGCEGQNVESLLGYVLPSSS